MPTTAIASAATSTARWLRHLRRAGHTGVRGTLFRGSYPVPDSTFCCPRRKENAFPFHNARIPFAAAPSRTEKAGPCDPTKIGVARRFGHRSFRNCARGGDRNAEQCGLQRLHAALRQCRVGATHAESPDRGANPALLAQSGKRLGDQPVNLADEKFAVYVPAQKPTGGYALLVFVPPWNDARLPDGWGPVLDQYGVIFVTAARSGNDANVFGRREPLALLAEQNVARRYAVNQARVLIAGFSGGSRVAMRLALAYPDLFHGAILNAGSDPVGSRTIPPARQRPVCSIPGVVANRVCHGRARQFSPRHGYVQLAFDARLVRVERGRSHLGLRRP